MLIYIILSVFLSQAAFGHAACPLYPPPCQQSAGVQGPCTSCCQALSSANIRYAPISLDQITLDSPFYTLILADLNDPNLIDNQCNTVFSVGNSTYILVRSTVKKDGTRIIQQIFLQGSSTPPGVFSFTGLIGASGSLSQVATGYVLGRIGPPCPVAYTFYQYSFNFSLSGINQYNSRIDEVSGCGDGNGFLSLGYAFTSAPNTPAQCVNQARQLFASAGTPPANYITPPNNLPYQCITRYLGADCINANRVLPAYRSSLDSCVC